ncbi:MAG: acyl-CoA dehydrogenase [Ilumatobacteraceae bacterium]|nr:acyl-CoA dehydrogenase [Ilumatobacteraceae bacterium]
MDFDDTPEEAAFRREANDWLSAHAKPKRDEAELSGMSAITPEAEREHVRESKAWQHVLYDNGWAGITWPKEFGGRGGTSMQSMIFAQEQAKFDVPSSVFSQAIGMAGPTLIQHGTTAQQERFLPAMLCGDEVWCQLFSEPGAGSDLAALSTRAELDGDEFVVNGQKVWTSSAHFSDWGILLARTDFDVPKHQGITYFLVDMRSPGIDVRPLRQITGSAHFNEVFLTDVRIPAANVVGEVNRGWGVTMTTLVSERTMIGSGTSNPVHDLLRLADRFGGRDDANTRQQLAATYTRMRLLQFTGWRVQTAISRGEAAGPESSVLKLAHTQQITAIADLSMDIAGASGMLSDPDDMEVYSWVQGFLSQWASKIGGGTDEVQRNIVSERVLGLPGDVRVDKNLPFRSLPR